MIFQRIRLAIKSIRAPTIVVRLTDYDGRKKVVVISRTIFGAKAVAKFEVLREFDPCTHEPNWQEIEFKSFDYGSKKVEATPLASTWNT